MIAEQLEPPARVASEGVKFRALGPLSVTVDGEERKLGGPRQRMVLAVLLNRANHTVSQDALIEEVWAGEPPEAARPTLHGYVYGLRHELGADAITRHGDGYRVAVDEDTFDVLHFQAMVSQARQRLPEDPSGAATVLREALALWYGEPYGGLDTNPILAAEAVRLRELRLVAVETRIDAALATGTHVEVIGELDTLVREHPLRERFRAQQMLALYRSGRQAEALRAFDRARVYLAEELGIDPSAELRDLEQRILEQDPSLGLESAAIPQHLAFLFTDVERSTLLWEIGPETATRAIDSQDRIITRSVDENKGRVFKRTGDGTYASFPDVAHAVAAARAAQRELIAHDWGETGEVRVRMAIDAGNVEAREDDFQGSVLHRVARILPLGHGAQILLSTEAHAALPDDLAALALGEYRLSGIGRPEAIFQLLGSDLPSEFPPLRADRPLSGPVDTGAGRMVRGYELHDPLGAGDFGVVYRAFQPAVGRQVAIKVIRAEYANQADFIARFEREAQLVAQLEHPHIVQLFDYWRDPEGAYLVMPLLRGGSLAQALHRGGWNLSPALRLVEQVGSALSYAHRRGVIHRDVKPGNVLLDEDGNAYLSDFGIATRLTDAADTPLTTSLAFVPPEELRGERHTTRSDVFSLGVLIFQLLTGIAPRPTLPLPALSGARPGSPTELDGVIARATDPDPANRFERMEDLLRAFRQAAGSDVVAVAETTETGPARQPVRNPYKGLRAFRETDALDFFGRDALVEELLQSVALNNLVAVVGPSGSGKSSVVRAGLVPALRAGGVPGSRQWLIAEMFPGSYPFEELEAALLRVAVDRPSGLLTDLLDENGLVRVSKQILPGDHTILLLVIDQFEEVFSAVSSEATRRLFLDNLVSVAQDERSRVRVVLTMRADFFSQSLEYAEFAEVLGHRMVTVGPPTKDGLAQAISAPARAVGVELEPGLVGRVISDVEGQPGGLPLVQYALTEMFSRRQGDSLTTEAYESAGGVLGALGQRAEEVYQSLPQQGKEAARQLFMRLVLVDKTAADTRRRARRSELRSLDVDQDALDQAINGFGGYRLLSFDRDPVTRGPTVEVAHEAVLREWDRLAGWIADRRDDLTLARRIGAAAQEWRESGSDPSFLLRGARLEQAEAWLAGTDIAPTADEVEYLEAGREQRSLDEAVAGRRRRLTVGVLSAGLVVLVILASVAFLQRGIAQGEARKEEVRRLAASSTVALGEDPERAILLALEAAQVSRRAGEPVRHEAMAALHRAVQTSRLEGRLEGQATGFGPDGELLVAELRHPVVLEAAVPWGALSPDGRLVAERVSGEDRSGRIVIWDPVSDQEVADLVPRTDSGRGMFVRFPLHWDPDGRMVAAIAVDETTSAVWLAVWEVASGMQVASIPITPITSVAFLDSDTVAVPDQEGERIAFFDISTGEEIDQLDTPGYAADAVAYDIDRNRLVVGALGDGLQAWDLDTRQEPLWSRNVSDAWVPTVHSHLGLVLVSGFAGGVWALDIDDGSDRGVLLGHESQPFRVSPAPQGPTVITASIDEVLMWDLGPAGPRSVGAIDLGPYFAFPLLSPDGTEVAVSTYPVPELQRFHLHTGEPVGSAIRGDLGSIELSSDWNLGGMAIEGKGLIMELSSGGTVLQTPPCTHPVAFSSEGEAAVLDGWALCPDMVPDRVIDTDSGAVLLDLGEGGVAGAVFNPPGTFEADRYLVVNRITRLDIYDMAESRLVTSLDVLEDWDDGVLGLAFDPTGRYLASGGNVIHAWVIDMELVAEGVPASEALVFNRPVDPGGVPVVAINSDGILATAGFGTLRLWDIHHGEQIIQIPVDIRFPPGPVFSHEGTHLLYVDATDTGHVLRRFLLDPDELIALAETRVTRGFTAEECRRYDLDC